MAQDEDTIAALRAQLKEYRDLFEFAPDGYLLTDPDGVIKDASHAAALLLRVPRKALIGKSLSLFIPGEDRPAFHRELAWLQGMDRVRAWELRLRPRRGAPLTVAAAVSRVRSEEGVAAGLRWLIRDVAPRKRAAAAETARVEAEEASRRLKFLLRASTELSASLDYRTRLLRLAELAVPELGDWCAVYIVEESRALVPLALTHADPARVEEVRAVQRSFSLDQDAQHPFARVVGTGRPVLIAELTEGAL